MKSKRQQIKGNVLADGEVTGHAHRVTVPVFAGPGGTREFDGETVVTHEEHKPIHLPNQSWASDQVREHDYVAQMTRRVVD